jgi:hypothetical protein
MKTQHDLEKTTDAREEWISQAVDAAALHSADPSVSVLAWSGIGLNPALIWVVLILCCVAMFYLMSGTCHAGHKHARSQDIGGEYR